MGEDGNSLHNARMGEIEINYACSFTVENFGWDGPTILWGPTILKGGCLPDSHRWTILSGSSSPHPRFLVWLDGPSSLKFYGLPQQGGRKETFYRSRVRLTIGTDLDKQGRIQLRITHPAPPVSLPQCSSRHIPSYPIAYRVLHPELLELRPSLLAGATIHSPAFPASIPQLSLLLPNNYNKEGPINSMATQWVGGPREFL
ncbi:hypothetical protein SUGI_1373810 [Cryptomeria japonica]|uniref:Uncharacterized protein n=1 Tax=Cryptomeria japonica TaxID=3369 RepID=A0AAD3NS52_CRYJA|nr:hypothetical protein SUGI_1373810 [Cryptomeria japonica]